MTNMAPVTVTRYMIYLQLVIIIFGTKFGFKISYLASVMVMVSYLVKFHEFPNTVEHVVVLGSGAGHLLYDGGHVTEDRGVQQG